MRSTLERTTTSMILRAKQSYLSLICDKQTLEFGISYFSSTLAALPEANQFREVIATTAEQANSAIEEATDWFSQQGLACYSVAPAHGKASSDLRHCLETQGYARRESKAMVLIRWEPSTKPEAMRMLPARAVRQAYQTAVADAIAGFTNKIKEQAVAAAIERLDSPQLDAFVAMDADRPLGYGGLFQVGDMAIVTDICVTPGGDTHGVQNALLSHVLSLAKRLEMRNIYYELPDTADSELRITLESWGFVRDGDIEEYQFTTPACDNE